MHKGHEFPAPESLKNLILKRESHWAGWFIFHTPVTIAGKKMIQPERRCSLKGVDG